MPICLRTGRKNTRAHDVLYKRAEALKNIIEHCLTGTKLTPIAKEIMKEYI